MSKLDDEIRRLRARTATSYEEVEKEIVVGGKTYVTKVKVYPPRIGGDGLLPADRDSERDRALKAASRARGNAKSATSRKP